MRRVHGGYTDGGPQGRAKRPTRRRDPQPTDISLVADDALPTSPQESPPRADDARRILEEQWRVLRVLERAAAHDAASGCSDGPNDQKRQRPVSIVMSVVATRRLDVASLDDVRRRLDIEEAEALWREIRGDEEPCELMKSAADIHGTLPGGILRVLGGIEAHRHEAGGGVSAAEVERMAPDSHLRRLEQQSRARLAELAQRVPDAVAHEEKVLARIQEQREAFKLLRDAYRTNQTPALIRRLRQASSDAQLTCRQIALLMMKYTTAGSRCDEGSQRHAQRLAHLEKWLAATAAKKKASGTAPPIRPRINPDRRSIYERWKDRINHEGSPQDDS